MLDFKKLWATHEFVAEHGLVLGVDKIGGGTVGREYTGDWSVTVYDSMTGAELETLKVSTGMPHDHKWIAEFVGQDIAWESGSE